MFIIICNLYLSAVPSQTLLALVGKKRHSILLWGDFLYPRGRAEGAPGTQQQLPAGETHGRAGHPLAAHGHHAEQISMCSRGEPSQEHSGQEQQPMGRILWWDRRAGRAAARAGQCFKGEPYGMDLCWSSAWRAAACRKCRECQFRKGGIP